MVLSISAYAMYGNAEKTHQQKAPKAKAPQQKAAARKAPGSQPGPQIANAQTQRQVQSPTEMWEIAVAQPMAWHVERGSFAASPAREEVNPTRDTDEPNSNRAILVGLGIAMISIFRRIRRFKLIN